MNVTMHLPPVKITGLTWVIEQAGTGPPVLQLCLHGNGTEIPLLVFRDLADLDEWIGGSALAKADFGDALARHAARPLVPLPPDVSGDLLAIAANRIGELPDLPGWLEMSDLDKGAALLHLHKREGGEYAESDYPARYFDDPRLTALTGAQACAHAVSVTGSHGGPADADEYARLYDPALAAAQKRFDVEFAKPLPDLPQREPRVRATSMTEHGQVIFTDYPGDLPQREPGVALGVTETQPGCTCMERDDPCAVHDAVRRVRLIPVDECSDPPAESCADAGCPEHGSVYAGLTEGLGSEDEPEPQPGGTIYAELSEEALAAHAPLASLAADPDEDGT